MLGLTPGEMEAALASHFRERGQPAYRAGQVRDWVFEKLAPDFGSHDQSAQG